MKFVPKYDFFNNFQCVPLHPEGCSALPQRSGQSGTFLLFFELNTEAMHVVQKWSVKNENVAKSLNFRIKQTAHR